MVLQCNVIDCDALMTDFSLVFLYDHCHFLDVTVETVDGILEDQCLTSQRLSVYFMSTELEGQLMASMP